MSTNWRFLVVEDKELFQRQLVEAIPTFVDAPDTVEVDLCGDFDEAIKKLREDRYDLLILDLKDDSDGWSLSDDDPAGLKVFEKLKETRFVPVVFYTALAYKVQTMERSFVRVVEKTESISRVREEVRRILDTKLPALVRRIEEIQRGYMWGFVNEHWKDFSQPTDQADIAYLLARRLAIEVEAEAGKLAATVGGFSGTFDGNSKVHPMALYVVPSTGPHPLAGDIVSEVVGESEVYWLILTPSCDFAQTKVDYVTLAKCERLVDREEFKNWSRKKEQSTTDRLEKLIGDGRSDRFKFLPRAFFIPDLVVDFQQLRCITKTSLTDFKQVATLDSPFAESVLARFSRYFNRLGTPDLDKGVVIKRLEAASNPPPKA